MSTIKALLKKYLANEADAGEIEMILEWLRTPDADESLLHEVWEEERKEAPPFDLRRIWMQVDAETQADVAVQPWFAGKRPIIRRLWPAVAAVLILVIASLFLLTRSQRADTESRQPVAAVPDAAPGRDGAILTLADGSLVSLDSAGKELPATQGGTRVKLSGNQLAYVPAGEGVEIPPASMTYNTVTTPRGRQFTLVLPDGSRVWLNAASSIRFPTSFTGKQRSVELSGEAYFEIAKDKGKPFFIHTEKSETEVLGTSFNISAYTDDDMVAATLLEGSIRTGIRQDQVILAPGEQAKIGAAQTGATQTGAAKAEATKTGGAKTGSAATGAAATGAAKTTIDVNHHANVEQAIAWKNGTFDFQEKGLKEVMRQLARWYDLEVFYEPGVKDVKFGGEMSRNIPLSSLLKGLKDMEVHFRIETDHRLVVMP
ncbi:MAG TPA: FecR family protein [Puia sp.]|nr:FecR family protein [Puia sp.]